MNARERTAEAELATLSPRAAKSRESRGRQRPEPECDVRTCFQRDRDRIIHSKAFRRLKDKTQVFLAPEGDHYRTRLTHTLEVGQIARTIARALRLNEDLTEAIALAHDLGHTPFGHAGEQALDEIHPGGFRHNEQSLRVVDVLERRPNGEAGLNLTWEVRDGILNHPGDRKAATLEGQIIKLADRIAYVNHDIDDAVRAGIISLWDLPPGAAVLGDSHGQRIDRAVRDVIAASDGQPEIRMSPEMWTALHELRAFLFQRVYIGSRAKADEEKAKRMLAALYRYFREHPGELPDGETPASRTETETAQAVCDYVAGMTDRYAIATYSRIFVPAPWALQS